MGAPLIELITADSVVVTAGQRLCRHVAERYASECRARTLAVWETPAILPFGAWLKRVWEQAVDEGADARLLLTDAQEMALWEQVITQTDRGAFLLSTTATAKLAHEAWSLMHAWELPRSELDKAGHEDVQSFAAWATAFEQLCTHNQWLDDARLAAVVVDLISHQRTRVPRRLIVAGFDELTPQQSRLFESLRRANCEMIQLRPDELPTAHAQRFAFASAEEEIHAAAQWARARLGADPAARIGILTPDLSAQHRTIRRVFDDVLSPETVLPGREEATRCYNISLGEPQASLPLIGAAFSILEFAQGALALAQSSELLRSPYLAGAEAEITQRAVLDVRLRRDVRMTLDTLAQALERADAVSACPILAERLRRFQITRAAVTRAQAPSRWVATIAQLLGSLGWPGERGRSSVEHQTIEAWRELLSDFGALDPVLSTTRYGEALARLQRLAQEKLFQRETPETPLQILGVLEAVGLEFDAVWVLGLHDEVWPSAPRPNPFLPVSWQRARGLPHASADRELEFCARLTQGLLRSAPEVVFSHPLREDDRDLRPSPLIRALPERARADAVTAPAPLYRAVIHRHSQLETIVDARAPPLPPGILVNGGAALFRAQSACPFRADAEFRLGAKQHYEPEPGLSAADRGTLVHDLLARLWAQLGSHAGLLAMAPAALAARVAELAAAEVDKLRRRRPEALTGRAAALECERLAALVLEWLGLEKNRAPFTVQRAEESKRLSVAGLETEARMDRVDELADGSLAVIDYKTGEVRLGDWLGERPADPQLPLYALYGVPQERLGALLYARLRRGESKFVGVARVRGVAPGIDAHVASKLAAQMGPWNRLVEQWNTALTALAQELRSGVARVSPRDKRTCAHCHLHAFCRIHDRRARLAGEGEESGDGSVNS